MGDIGYFGAATAPHHQAAIEDLFHQIMTLFQANTIFNFAGQTFPNQLRKEAMALGKGGDFWHIPPIKTLYFHRKFGGIYLLANRLEAKVNVHQLLVPYAL